MLTEQKPWVPPDYPPRPTAPYEELIKIYLETHDFYDLPDEVQYDAGLYADAHEMERIRFFKRDSRLVIYPSDLVAIYGLSDRWARQMLFDMRVKKGLPRLAAITIRDFCAEVEFDYETIHAFIMES